MSVIRLSVVTVIAMIAFASNSLLCRIALSATEIDAASFTTIRLVSGAITLFVLVWWRDKSLVVGGNWLSALALFAYAAGFSFAYLSLSAATGALLLFGAVQATMIGYGLFTGERLNMRQIIGILLALFGLIGLLLPGLQAPPLFGAILMLGAGIAWGIYSLRGRVTGDPTQQTAGNFVRAVPMAVVVSALPLSDINIDIAGSSYAVASGAIASGMGYAVWYTALPYLRATSAATVQLSVPVLAAAGGIVFLNEPITMRFTLASLAILGGVAFFLLNKRGVVGTEK
jgi:drug/metabolite transporter (DMT)-like permease